mgnify:CR=1 FL=1
MSTEARCCLADPYSLQEPVYSVRIAAGWRTEEGDSGAIWLSPTDVQEAQWEEQGWPFPEDEGYAPFIASRPDLAG